MSNLVLFPNVFHLDYVMYLKQYCGFSVVARFRTSMQKKKTSGHLVRNSTNLYTSCIYTFFDYKGFPDSRSQ